MSGDSFPDLVLAIAILPMVYRKLIIPILGAGATISIGPSCSGWNETSHMCRSEVVFSQLDLDFDNTVNIG